MCPAISAAGLPAAPGGPSPAGSDSGHSEAESAKRRSAFYIDGFNLYHALDDLAQPHLKWLNLWEMAEALINKRQERLVSVHWCSAEHHLHSDKRQRHRAYQKALVSAGVQLLIGHFVSEEVRCKECRETYMKDTEKQGDINVAHPVDQGCLRGPI